jgi:hypothetical protein
MVKSKKFSRRRRRRVKRMNEGNQSGVKLERNG